MSISVGGMAAISITPHTGTKRRAVQRSSRLKYDDTGRAQGTVYAATSVIEKMTRQIMTYTCFHTGALGSKRPS